MGNPVPLHPSDSERPDPAPEPAAEPEGQYQMWDDGEKQYELGYN